MAAELSALVDHTTGWDWENSHVQQSYVDANQGQDISINDIIESGTVLIAAGPADLNSMIRAQGQQQFAAQPTDPPSDPAPMGFRIVPIGLVETAQISMNKPLSRIFEIGSKLSYIIPGRTIGGISLSRVFFDGPSLLKVIYMGEVLKDQATEGHKEAVFQSGEMKNKNLGDIKYQHIGSGQIAMNLASSFFDQPVGLAFLFRDQENQTVGQIYFEGCRVSTYNIGISAQMNVLTEAISMEFVRCRPIVITASSNWSKADVARSLADVDIVGPTPT